MVEKHTSEAGQAVLAARMSADTRRRWDEVRQMREQVMSRQEQVIQQTRADVRRHVERMRHVRASIVSPEPPRSVKQVEPAPKPSAPKHPQPGPRFDFDARRAAWEQRRREQAEKREAEIARRNEPYQEQRRQLEEKRRLALLEQSERRSTSTVQFGTPLPKPRAALLDRPLTPPVKVINSSSRAQSPVKLDVEKPQSTPARSLQERQLEAGVKLAEARRREAEAKLVEERRLEEEARLIEARRQEETRIAEVRRQEAELAEARRVEAASRAAAIQAQPAKMPELPPMVAPSLDDLRRRPEASSLADVKLASEAASTSIAAAVEQPAQVYPDFGTLVDDAPPISALPRPVSRTKSRQTSLFGDED